MKTFGFILAILGGILLIFFAFLHAHVQGGWVLVPIGLLGLALIAFTTGAKESKQP